ncbi:MULTISPECIES: TIGR04438 family Trp-rich protein [Comamonadaceae]|uniref:TIGR04438 family Trp-rich protein n=1 Tax=Acidovorax sacchari TaxID=3230736 RepID=UPI0034A30C92
MYTLGLGILLVVLKYLEIGPVAQWSWWWVLSPFAVTAAWWAWADATGYTKRRAMEKIDRRRQDRIDRHKEAMGVKPRRPR